MAQIHQLITSETTARPPPAKIYRPCDYGLFGAVRSMEAQVGTVETYNKLCDTATALKAQIDAGKGKQALAMFATDPAFIYPLTS